MPESKKRKKKGKTVSRRKEDQLSGVTLQDLINVLAAQEAAKPDDDPTKMHNPNLKENEVVDEQGS